MEKIQLLSCPVPQADVLHTMSEFDIKDVQKWFEGSALPRETIGNVAIGKMRIENTCLPRIDNQEFLSWERGLVFFALGKKVISLFKSEVRVFVWRPLAKNFFVLPRGIISLDLMCHQDLNRVGGYTFLLDEEQEKFIKEEVAYGESHSLYEANTIYREFVLYPFKIKATRDILKQTRRWTNYDWWACPHAYKKIYPAMHFLRNDFSKISLYNREYPKEPHGNFGEVDE